MAASNGALAQNLKARLGHAGPTETLETCSHLWPDTEDRTRRAIDDLWGAAASPRGHTEATNS